MSHGSPSPTQRLVWIVVAATILVVGLVLFATGSTPWVAPVGVLICVTMAIAQRASWPFAFAAAVVLVAALTALVVRFTPSSGIGLVSGATALLALLGAAGLVVFAVVRDPRLVGVRAMRVGLPILAVPVLLISIVWVLTLSSGNLEWAMHNDAVWNLVTTRIMVEDGGLDAISHPNASPLTPGLLAIAIAVGRESVAPTDLLAFDVGRFAGFWLASVLTAAVLAALIGARSVYGGTRTARVVAAGLASLIPISWFTFGFAAQFGFYNSTLALVLLLATWLAWLEARTVPVVAAAVLSLASVALLATWAPLALVPFVLAVFALVSRLPSLRQKRGRVRELILLALAAAPVPAYVVLVTLPDLRRDGGALAVDGGFMALSPEHVLVITAVTLGVAVLNAVQRSHTHQLTGVVVVCISGALAGAYLVAQRIDAASLWGYYPAKFAWILVSLLLVILTASLAGEMAGLRGRPVAAAGIATVALIVPASLMSLVPPPTDRLASLLTPIAIATNKGVAAGEPAARRLFDLAEPGTRTLALSYLSPEGDRFLNSWLLQLESTTAQDPIRTYSYVLDPRDDQQACDAVRVWGGPVRVVTSDASVGARFEELCAGAAVLVEVRVP